MSGVYGDVWFIDIGFLCNALQRPCDDGLLFEIPRGVPLPYPLFGAEDNQPRCDQKQE